MEKPVPGFDPGGRQVREMNSQYVINGVWHCENRDCYNCKVCDDHVCSTSTLKLTDDIPCSNVVLGHKGIVSFRLLSICLLRTNLCQFVYSPNN